MNNGTLAGVEYRHTFKHQNSEAMEAILFFLILLTVADVVIFIGYELTCYDDFNTNY